MDKIRSQLSNKLGIGSRSEGYTDETILLKSRSTTSQLNYSATSQQPQSAEIDESTKGYQSANNNDLYEYDNAESSNDLHSYNDKSVSNRINEWQAAWNVTNAIQGMFVVSLPFAVAHGGYWALLAMLLVAYVCCYTGKILVDCLYDEKDDELVDIFSGKLRRFVDIKVYKSKRHHRIRNSYVDIAQDVWGSQVGARLVNLAQNIELLMTCILYLVLCGDLFVGSFPDLSLDHSAWTMISCVSGAYFIHITTSY